MASYGNEDVTLDVNEELIDEQDLITEPEISNDEINEPLDDIILDDESIAINPDSDDALEILPEIAAALDKPDEEDNIAEEAYNSLSKSRDATQIYLGEIGFSPLLSAEEEIKYARLAKKGDPEGRKRMIESNLRLVVKISRKYLNRGMALLDLIEEGNLGLMKAVEKFDPERGFRFSTYATWWIRQTIERAIMNQTRTIRLPIHVVKELNIYLRAARQLTHTLDHEPSPEEIAAQVDKPLEDIKRLFSFNEKITSVDTPIGHEDSKTMLETLTDENSVNPSEKLTDDDIKNKIEYFLTHLTDNQLQVIVRRFGLQGHEKCTLEEVGEEIGLTRERVRQIQVEALKTLKKLMDGVGIGHDDIF